MSGYREILSQFGDILLAETKAVSKRFANSVELDTTETSLSISASPYIGTLIHGRKPTSPTAQKGDPTLQEIILEWIKTKSIYANKSSMSQEALSWAISQSLHRYGDELYQRGGGPNIFENILTDQRVSSISNLLLDKESKALGESIFKDLIK